MVSLSLSRNLVGSFCQKDSPAYVKKSPTKGASHLSLSLYQARNNATKHKPSLSLLFPDGPFNCMECHVDPVKREKLDWKKRYDVIIGVTRGLLYLHEGAHCCIIHRDIKASNVLLDEQWVPKIADFGMARLYTEDHTYVKTRLAGTNGYMAPEYVMHGSLSIKADVFSFGILLLEIISGKKISTFISDPDGQGLLEWAWNLYKKNRSFEMIDPTLALTAVADQVKSCIQIGLLCTERDPRLRPTMQRVLVLLSKKPGTFEEPMKPGFLGSRNWRDHGSTGGSSSSQAESSSRHASTLGTASASTIRTNTTTSTFTSPRSHHSHLKQPKASQGLADL